ncbi:MAG: hypothetical protein JSS63_00410 [Bacteroidetes bacterium]|nr:hypothetical protein [Bacteroidota bacterium]
MKLTRNKIIDRIPFSFGIIQRVADDLRVSRSAVSQFINKPENRDILELLEQERTRIYDYAELNVFEAIVGSDMETTKWYLSTFPREGAVPQRKHSVNYKNRLNKQDEFFIGSWDYTEVRKVSHKQLDREDAYLNGVNALPFTKAQTKLLKDNPPRPSKYLTTGKEKNTKTEEKRVKRKG